MVDGRPITPPRTLDPHWRWCDGDMKGYVVTNTVRPATLWMQVVSMPWARVKAIRVVVKRRAGIDFPARVSQAALQQVDPSRKALLR